MSLSPRPELPSTAFKRRQLSQKPTEGAKIRLAPHMNSITVQQRSALNSREVGVYTDFTTHSDNYNRTPIIGPGYVPPLNRTQFVPNLFRPGEMIALPVKTTRPPTRSLRGELYERDHLAETFMGMTRAAHPPLFSARPPSMGTSSPRNSARRPRICQPANEEVPDPLNATGGSVYSTLVDGLTKGSLSTFERELGSCESARTSQSPTRPKKQSRVPAYNDPGGDTAGSGSSPSATARTSVVVNQVPYNVKSIIVDQNNRLPTPGGLIAATAIPSGQPPLLSSTSNHLTAGTLNAGGTMIAPDATARGRRSSIASRTGTPNGTGRRPNQRCLKVVFGEPQQVIMNLGRRKSTLGAVVL